MTQPESSCENIVVSVDGRVMSIVINRPEKKNALTVAMYSALAAAIQDAEADEEVRCMLITGTEDSFSSGNDVLDFMMNPPKDLDSPPAQFLRAIASAAKPIVAAVNGAAIGIGTTMLLHCDLVYAASNARFRTPFVNLGLCPEAASSLLLPQLMGHQRAAEWLLLGDLMEAETAEAYGLINQIFPPDQLMERALEKARHLAEQPAEALRLSKALMKKAHGPRIEEVMVDEGNHFMERVKSPEAAEAFQAFLRGQGPSA